ncbi:MULTISPECIES: hypothetical protein [unclassified Rhodococcus (in: high G+C Gram-positive bacteria)]|nr:MULTISPECIES: hypothetical protein [unclassified Rhodococcus (in: high G+C Gram-positive bacteria)]
MAKLLQVMYFLQTLACCGIRVTHVFDEHHHDVRLTFGPLPSVESHAGG